MSSLELNLASEFGQDISTVLTEEWAWLRTIPSRPWHCEGFVDCLELSLAWAVLESYEDVVEKPLCNKVSHFSFSTCVNIFGIFRTDFVLPTLDFRLVVQKLRREFTHARTLGGILNKKSCAWVNSRCNFLTTNLKSSVTNAYNPCCACAHGVTTEPHIAKAYLYNHAYT